MLDQQRAPQSAQTRHGGRVMIVEDDADIATLVSDVLAEEGYETHIVTDPRQAVETFERLHPDVVTLYGTNGQVISQHGNPAALNQITRPVRHGKPFGP